MKQSLRTAGRRTAALATALVMGASLLSPALAAGEAAPLCDETYYATLDCYGGLVESSVVKSYRTNGSTRLTDYGTYDQVVNLTDGRPAAVDGGQVTFDLSGETPDKFYFEGKTALPYQQFPWILSLSYRLNGVPVPAEELAGAQGVVEIVLDVVPNPAAPEYSRNNLVLTAASVFNGDDILSLSAPGAQVQLMGNLYCVLCAVLPGQEEHFAIQVGTEDFSYGGMVFVAVPATLAQLEQVAELREAKESAEDSYHAISDSLDVILNTLDGMSGSLHAAANGLDQLNQARGSLSGGKDQVYDRLDSALAAGGELAAALEPAVTAPVDAPEGTLGHLAAARQALGETTDLLNQVSANLTALAPQVEEARRILSDLRDNLAELQALLDSGDKDAEALRRISRELSGDLEGLEDSLAALRGALNGAGGLTSVPGMTINGMSPDEIRAAAAQARAAHAQYEAAVGAGQFDGTFQEFLVLAAGLDEATARQLDALYNTPDLDSMLDQADTANGIIGGVNNKLGEVNRLIGGLTKPAAAVVGDLEPLTNSLGQLVDLLEEAAGSDTGALSDALDLLDRAAQQGIQVSANADAALEQLQSLTDLMNTYQPQAQQALTDAETLVTAASAGLSALTNAAQAAENLARASGPSLDSGAQQSLSGLSAALRRSTAGLEQTGVIQDALDTIDALITDQWDSHSGQADNLLLIDGTAAPQSLTDRRNQGTASIQYVMRTQEIKAGEDAGGPEAAPGQAVKTTFWGRVKAMFRDIWAAVTGIF